MKFKNIFKLSNNTTSTPMSTGVGLPSKRGFTIMELLVVVFVSSLIATIVMANFGDFTSNAEFENVALNVALTMKEAQAYGIGGKESSGNFNSAYGVVFSVNKPYSFTLNTFRDLNSNNNYYTSSETSIKKTFSIKDGFKISDVCYISACNTSAAFVFKRPNPDARIYKHGGGIFTGGNYSNGKVVIERISNGSTKTINITNTGQIYVN